MFPIDDIMPPAPGSADNLILRLIAENGMDVAARAAANLHVTRQAVNRRLRELTEVGVVVASGNTRSRFYQLKILEDTGLYQIKSGDDEGVVWRQFVAPKLDGLKRAWSICHYAFTEIYNNAIDHSEGTEAIVSIRRSALAVEMNIADNGVGIFRKLQDTYGYSDEREAILELVKGRLTTDTSRHTGWGIFYTSRMCDTFSIRSGNYYFQHSIADGDRDWLLERAEAIEGTLVTMTVLTQPSYTTQDVLARYSMPNTLSLNITHVPLALAQYGEEKLISRSQAKQVASRFDWFQQVVLDFSGVTYIGQAFADELFRVWQRAHPEIRLVPINTSPDIDSLIRNAQIMLLNEEETAESQS